MHCTNIYLMPTMCQALALLIDIQVNKTNKPLLTRSLHPILVTYNAQRMSQGDSYYGEKQSREGVGVSGGRLQFKIGWSGKSSLGNDTEQKQECGIKNHSTLPQLFSSVG